MLHKNRFNLGRRRLDDTHRLEPCAVDSEREGDAGCDKEVEGFHRIPVKPGRELIDVSRQGARCYRLEKIKCGKRGCRCARGELHGPYWYAYYRENGRMRCEYMGKRLPELVRLETRARQALKSAKAERKRAVKIVAEVKGTLRRLHSF